MALPIKLNSADVKGWARNKMRATGKNAVKAAKGSKTGGSKLSQRLAQTKGAAPPPPFGKKADDPSADDDKDTKLDPKDPKAAKGKKPLFGNKKTDKDSDKEDPDDDTDPDDDEDAPPGKAKAKGKAAPFGSKNGTQPGKTGTKDAKNADPDEDDDDDQDEDGDDDEDEDPDEQDKKAPPPGRAKAPADDPNATKQKAPGAGKGTDPQPGDKPFPPKQGAGAPGSQQLPNTEPKDPMNAGGPGIPEELLQDDGDDIDDTASLPDADPILAEVEEKLGDFAETLEDRADELEELASEVAGDLSGDNIDIDTKREVQQLIPDDLRQDLVEHLSGMSDEEIEAFCQHLLEINKISDPELMAGFLRAAASNSTDEEDGDDEEDDDSENKDDIEGESDTESGEDE